MSEPIRSASASAARPLVHSRRVSLRLGSFGLTYSTDRLLWDPDAPPVAPAPAVEGQPPAASQTAPCTFPLDMEAARQQSLRQAAQQQAQAERQKAGAAPRTDPAARSQAHAPAPDGVDGARAESGSCGPGPARAEGSLRQAMRQATRAYLACAASFACPRPMIRAVA